MQKHKHGDAIEPKGLLEENHVDANIEAKYGSTAVLRTV